LDEEVETTLFLTPEEDEALKKVINEMKIGWKKLAKITSHLCYQKLGKEYVSTYFEKLKE